MNWAWTLTVLLLISEAAVTSFSSDEQLSLITPTCQDHIDQSQSYITPQPVKDPLWNYFSNVAGQDGEIDAQELQLCLTASGIHGTHHVFNKATCVVMIAMLDRDYSGKMGFSEFKELWSALNQWKASFNTFDRDRSGTMEPHELHQTLESFGYRLSPATLGSLIHRFAVDGRISFDDFVLCAIRMRSLTAHFRARDASQIGQATFLYDDFIQVAVGL